MDYLHHLFTQDGGDQSAAQLCATPTDSALQTSAPLFPPTTPEDAGLADLERTLLMSAVTHRAVLVATAASVANAVARHALHIRRLSDMRAFFPTEASTLDADPLLATTLRAQPAAILQALQSFDQRTAFAVRISTLITGSTENTNLTQKTIEADELATLVDCWTKAARAALVTLEALQPNSNMAATCPTHDAALSATSILVEVSGGRHPCVKGGCIEIPGWAERRSAVRHLTNQTVAVTRGSVSWVSKLRDISATGAGLSSDEPVAIGDVLTLTLADTRMISGRVRWTRDDRCGIEFSRPLTDDDPMLQSPEETPSRL